MPGSQMSRKHQVVRRLIELLQAFFAAGDSIGGEAFVLEDSF